MNSITTLTVRKRKSYKVARYRRALSHAEFTDLVGHMVQSNKEETHSDVLLLLPHQYNQKPTMKARAPVEPQEACEGAHRRYTLREPVGSRGGRGRPTRLK